MLLVVDPKSNPSKFTRSALLALRDFGTGIGITQIFLKTVIWDAAEALLLATDTIGKNPQAVLVNHESLFAAKLGRNHRFVMFRTRHSRTLSAMLKVLTLGRV